MAQPPVSVEIISVEAHGGSNAIRASGLAAYRRETALSFSAPGEIDSLTVDAGDRVAAGQALAALRRTSVGADRTEAALARDTAERNFDRVSRLHASGAVSQADLDAARLALERTRERIVLTAPAAGVILRRDAERGQVMNAGQPLLWLGETSSGVVVRASVAAGEAARITAGDAASVQTRGGEALAGKVLRVAPRSVEGTGAYEIEILVDKPGGLRSGEVAEATIVTSVAGDTAPRFAVPALALIDARADQGVVFVVDAESRARRRAITTGGVNDDGVIILDGLEAGDRVITRGASMVREGDPVTVTGLQD